MIDEMTEGLNFWQRANYASRCFLNPEDAIGDIADRDAEWQMLSFVAARYYADGVANWPKPRWGSFESMFVGAIIARITALWLGGVNFKAQHKRCRVLYKGIIGEQARLQREQYAHDRTIRAIRSEIAVKSAIISANGNTYARWKYGGMSSKTALKAFLVFDAAISRRGKSGSRLT